MKYALTNSVICTKYEILRDYAVVIDGETIEAVIHKLNQKRTSKPLDLQGNNLTAGFIDLAIKWLQWRDV